MNYTNFKSIITSPLQVFSYKKLLFYILSAYIFGFTFRLYLAYDVIQLHPEYFFHGRIIPIWASDAGLYGFYAKQLMLGEKLPYDDIHMLGHILYWLHNITKLHIDTIVFYAPAVLAPLIVIPIILISKLYKLTQVGFFAALITSIGFNYYFRTHLGYADTDILIYTLTLFLVYSIIAITETKNIRYILVGIFAILLLSLMYHSWKPLVLGLMFTYYIFIIIFDRKTHEHYVAFFFLLFSILGIPLLLKILLLIISYILYFTSLSNKKWLTYPYPFYSSVGIFLITIFIVSMNKKYYVRIVEYFTKPENFHFTDQSGNTFAFSGMLQDILEAKTIPFLDSIQFIAGSPIIFILAFIGLVLLIIRNRSALLLLPLLFLGMSTFIMGLRFSTFAVPIIAIGIVYFIFHLTYQLNKLHIHKYITAIIYYVMLSLVLGYTALISLHYHKAIAPKYTADQAEALYNLSISASPNDYIISLWDNGWPIWYASGLKTLTHNGKHGFDSFIIAQILTSKNSIYSANISRYFLEKYNKFYEKGSIFRKLLKKKNMKNELKKLKFKDAKLPEKTFDIYYYLNDQSLLKLETIKKYAQIPLDETVTFTFLSTKSFKKKGYITSKDFIINIDKGFISSRKKKNIKLGYLINSDGIHYQHMKYPSHKNANLNVIIYKNRYLFVMNDNFVQSFAASAYLLNQYDKELFKMISITEYSKILKLKI